MVRITGFMYSTNTSARINDGNITREINDPLPFIPIIVKPTEKSFSITLCVDGMETEKDHELQIILKYGEKIIIDFGKYKLESKRIEPSMVLGIDIRNVKVEEEGEYLTEVLFDGDIIGSYPIFFRLLTAKK